MADRSTRKRAKRKLDSVANNLSTAADHMMELYQLYAEEGYEVAAHFGQVMTGLQLLHETVTKINEDL